MKKSSVVVLVISGALLAGCDSSDRASDDFSSGADTQTYTNNHYAAGRGYYHAPYHSWYPFPYNYHDPARGYYYGGGYSTAPHVSGITASRPAMSSAARSSFFGGSSSRSSSPSSSSVSRGGFSSSHSSSSTS